MLYSRTQPAKHEAYYEHDLLIKSNILQTELFQTIATNFEKSEHKELVLHVIQNLLITYDEDNYIEVNLGLVYTALEMLVFGLTQQSIRILSSSAFKRASDKIEQFIQQNLELENGMLSALIEKLPELNRYSFKYQLKKMFTDLGLDILKFWPTDTDPENVDQVIGEMLKRRNVYIHQGAINDVANSLEDYHRIRLMIEVAILKLLGYPMNQINHEANVFEAIGRSLPDHYSFDL